MNLKTYYFYEPDIGQCVRVLEIEDAEADELLTKLLPYYAGYTINEVPPEGGV